MIRDVLDAMYVIGKVSEKDLTGITIIGGKRGYSTDVEYAEKGGDKEEGGERGGAKVSGFTVV